MLFLMGSLLLFSYFLFTPYLVMGARSLNDVLKDMSVSQAVRVLCGLLTTLIYSGLMITYLIHIHHAVLIVFLVAPSLFSYLLQSFESQTRPKLSEAVK